MVTISVPNRPMFWRAYGGSPFNHPDCPPDALCYISYSRDPSFDKDHFYTYFVSVEGANVKAKELRRDGWCVGGPRVRR